MPDQKTEVTACKNVAGEWGTQPMMNDGTVFVHGGSDPDSRTGAILAPIYQSTTFVQESVENYLDKGFSYSREANPTVVALEKRIAAIEGAAHCVCFGSGMAATTTIFSSYLQPGDHCVITNCSYGGTNRAARVHFSKYQIQFSFVDFRNVGNVAEALKSNTKMIFSETPCNPTLNLANVEEISKLAKSKGIVHVCDSTFGPPPMMKALSMGPDMLIISTTKFYDGHNLTVGGAVVTNDEDVLTKVKFHRNVLGNIMAPQTAFYTQVTSKTLHVRVERQSRSALMIAEFLESHDKVKKVYYPGLKSFAQAELATKQHPNGMHGGMLAFEVVDSPGGDNYGRKLMNSITRPWSLCENLGSAESIITCPSVFTHANMLKEDRMKVGITDGFVRLSVGLEEPSDLIAALKLALNSL
eukprot:GHVN01098456.1.p1 GENE.GHVN01098456.1~~GHVN01098456.1.p1  ORF type:complete len:413 (+),score=34.56 GHVN01098456.1:48-1286(+)